MTAKLTKSPNQPVVSVVIVVLNGAKYISNCLASIQRQTLSDLEVVLVDGGSTDGTPELFHSFLFRDGISIKFIDNRNEKNIVDSFQRGVAAASAPYVFQLCVDDELFDIDWLVLARNAFDQDSKVAIVQGRSITRNQEDSWLFIYPPLRWHTSYDHEYLRYMYDLTLADSTLLIKKEVFLKCFPDAGSTDARELTIPHTAFDLNFLKSGFQAVYINSIAHLGLHHTSRRSNKFRREETKAGLYFSRERLVILRLRFRCLIERTTGWTTTNAWIYCTLILRQYVRSPRLLLTLDRLTSLILKKD